MSSIPLSFAYPFGLALAAALFDVTIGYPSGLARRIGTPAQGLANWLKIVRIAALGWSGAGALLIYLGPPVVAAACVALVMPSGPIGFALTALIASTFQGRQNLDARARAVAGAWETQGLIATFGAAEALGAEEADPSVQRAAAAAIAARFADEVAAPTAFLLIGGLAGVVFCRAVTIAGRAARESRDASDFGRAVAGLERWTVLPAARAGALFLALAGGRGWRAVTAPGARPTAPAEAALIAALGDPQRDDPAYLRRALALYRRAAALELCALAVLPLTAAFADWVSKA